MGGRSAARRLFAATGLAAAAGACGGGEAHDAAVEERDSAGIRIVETPAAAAAAVPEWTLGEAAGTVGEQGSGVELHAVGRALRVADGRVASPNGGSELLLYDPRTGAVRRFGGKGRGPGEFEGMSLWRAGGDTLLAYDMTLARVTPFLADTGFLASFPVPSGSVDGLVHLQGRLADGTLVGRVVRGFDGRHAEGPNADSADLVRVAASGELRPFARVLFAHQYVDDGFIVAIPFGAGSLLAAGGTGIFVAGQDRYEIVEYGGDGAPRRVIRREVRPRPVLREEVEPEKATWVANGANRADTEHLFAEMPLPTHHPVLARMLVDAEGNLWVAETAGPDEPTPWSVFDAGGRMVGRLETPPRFLATDAGADYLLGVQRDEDDVESVVLYPLERR